MDIQSIIRSFLKSLWVVIIITVVTGISVFILQLNEGKKYESEAQLSTGITLNNSVVESSKYMNPYEINVSFDNLIEQIKSRSVIGLLSYSLIINELSKSQNELSFVILEGDELDFLKNSKRLEELLKLIEDNYENLTVVQSNETIEKEINALLDLYGFDYTTILDNLSVVRIGATDFISIRYISSNPNLSAYVVNKLCSEFIRYYVNQRSEVSATSLQSLEGILQSKKDDFDRVSGELRVFKTQNRILESDGSLQIQQSKLSEIGQMIQQEKININGLKLSLENVNSKIGKTQQKNTVNNSLIIEYDRRIKELNERYILEGSDSQELLDSITTLRDLRLKEQSRLSGSSMQKDGGEELLSQKNEIEVDLQIANSNLSYLSGEFDRLQNAMGSYSKLETSLGELQNRMEIARTEYLSALANFNDAKDKLTVERLKIKQVLFGEPAESPNYEELVMFPAFATVLSFVLSSFIIIMIEVLDNRIRTITRAERLTDMKISGVLLYLKEVDGNPARLLGSNGSKPIKKEFMQELRKIRHEIIGQKDKIFLFTSLKPKEGKSFTMLSLAFSLSLLNKKVLLLDTNFASNHLTNVFKANPIFEEVSVELGNKETDSEHIKECFNGMKEIHPKVFLLGSKKSSFSPQEILSNINFERTLLLLKRYFDLIFLEGAALNDYSDTKELVKYCEKVIPVISARTEIKNADLQSLSYLKGELGDKLGKFVLNKINTKLKNE